VFRQKQKEFSQNIEIEEQDGKIEEFYEEQNKVLNNAFVLRRER